MKDFCLFSVVKMKHKATMEEEEEVFTVTKCTKNKKSYHLCREINSQFVIVFWLFFHHCPHSIVLSSVDTPWNPFKC